MKEKNYNKLKVYAFTFISITIMALGYASFFAIINS